VLGLHSQLDKHSFSLGNTNISYAFFHRGARAFLCPGYEPGMVKKEKPYMKVRGEAIPYASLLVF
jgi:hypothetical protein